MYDTIQQNILSVLQIIKENCNIIFCFWVCNLIVFENKVLWIIFRHKRDEETGKQKIALKRSFIICTLNHY